ncbi:MAG: hypothetical protein COV29_04005 [Candidatus Yanofskybacteria bacterium CG10_big_fil_rev_8_21_14_0_10_36_16]|uniref:Type II secretion system protein GspH n=1 Tax=Candidatus Yanofskybacteria bacterium CG10_big_fil_rev_8_21_14_0_10_36_16 TaxID=1975096 RepID=A0A2J0Q6Q0_9BACT|nr:MAG: hypothetical protein COV29_04005 [Candidatus Yanofskybacteria bacterium CG10_big_fil_rev_8_21_14_0_10_36_16]
MLGKLSKIKQPALSFISSRKYFGNSNSGFSLIEVLLVTTILSILSTVLILTFRSDTSNQVSRIRAAKVIATDIRRIQSLALSTTSYDGETTCGYGMLKQNSNTYILYAGLSGGITCQSKPKNYQAGIDKIIEVKQIINSNLKFQNNFKDIFFKPPDPIVYFQNTHNINAQPEEIKIIKKSENTCAQSPCTIVKVYVSGKVEIVP